MTANGTLATARSPANDGSGRPLRVLVAEDHPVNRKLLAMILREAEVETELVVNGLEAVEAGTARRFDVLFFDLRMPSMSGLDALRALRSGQANAQTPAVVLTAEDVRLKRPELLAAGFDIVIEKPFTATEVITAINILISPR